jgi:hypothetical protein
LGGGGSVLTVPIFVYLLGFSPKEAIAMSLAVVGATSAFGTASHWRAGNVNVHVAAVFGGVAMLGTLIGVRLARFVPGTTQLVILGVVMLAAAVFMLRSRPPCEDESAKASAEPLTSVLKVMPGGLLVGSLTGIVGVGGGFLIVPALARPLHRTSPASGPGTAGIVGRERPPGMDTRRLLTCVPMLPTLFVILTFLVLYWFPIRRWMSRWGATPSDRTRVMTGDALSMLRSSAVGSSHALCRL